MTQLQPDIQVKDIDHLGIIADMIDEMGLVDAVNELVGTHTQEQVSTGHALKAMILNGIGFVSAPLYLFEQFFSGKATEHLMGSGVLPEHRNDNRLGRAQGQVPRIWSHQNVYHIGDESGGTVWALYVQYLPGL